MAVSRATWRQSMWPVVMYWEPAENTPELAAPTRMLAPTPAPTPVATIATPATTTAAAATYCQLSATQDVAASQALASIPECAWL